MAIEDKKYNRIHGKDGNNKNTLKAKFDDSMHSIAVEHPDDWPELAAVIYQIGQLEEEIDYLRGLISTNKDKATFPGFGTSGSTCLAGNTTTISGSQASAITANTAKTGITTQQTSAITANEKAGNNNASAITTNTASIVSAIKVGSYPSVPSGVAQSHASEIVYDSKNKKYYINIYYVEEVPGKGGGKGTSTVRTGQIELT